MAAVAMIESESGARPTRAKIFEQAWIWSVVGYSVLRFVVAWGAFAGHGVNPWIFGLIDVGTAWPYAKAVAMVCQRAAHSEWHRLPGPIAIAVATFFAPYAYLWVAAGTMPAGVRFAMVLFVSVLFVAATLGVVSKSRKLRREAATSTAGAYTEAIDLRDATVDGLIIDLRSETKRTTR